VANLDLKTRGQVNDAAGAVAGCWADGDAGVPRGAASALRGQEVIRWGSLLPVSLRSECCGQQGSLLGRSRRMSEPLCSYLRGRLKLKTWSYLA